MMKLIKVTSEGSLHFEMTDGRRGVSYESGYVRISVKPHNIGRRGTAGRMYQINKKLTKECDKHGYYYERVLLPNQNDRINRLLQFNRDSCQPKKL